MVSPITVFCAAPVLGSMITRSRSTVPSRACQPRRKPTIWLPSFAVILSAGVSPEHCDIGVSVGGGGGGLHQLLKNACWAAVSDAQVKGFTLVALVLSKVRILRV